MSQAPHQTMPLQVSKSSNITLILSFVFMAIYWPLFVATAISGEHTVRSRATATISTILLRGNNAGSELPIEEEAILFDRLLAVDSSMSVSAPTPKTMLTVLACYDCVESSPCEDKHIGFFSRYDLSE